MAFGRLTIRKKLFAAFGMVALVAMSFLAVSHASLQKVQELSDAVAPLSRHVEMSQDGITALEHLASTLSTYALIPSEENRELVMQDLEQLRTLWIGIGEHCPENTELRSLDALSRYLRAYVDEQGNLTPARSNRLLANIYAETHKLQASVHSHRINGMNALRANAETQRHQIDHIIPRFYVIELAIVIIGIILAWMLSAYIVQGLKSLGKSAQAVASGDLQARCSVNTNDELQSLANTFNQMVEELQHTTVSRDALAEEIHHREKAEAEREEIHQQLVATSRQAGMAEVATGVLHNVGNVLNSINVASNLVTESLETTRLPLLSKLAQTVKYNEDHLDEFFTKDPKGKAIPSFLQDLAQTLTAEHNQIQSECETLIDGVEQIKEIVAVQMDYAVASGVTESVELGAIINDVLQIYALSLKNAGIELSADLGRDIIIQTDRHSVLQILINLMSNAKDAVVGAGNDGGQVTITVAQPTRDTVCIRVTDNGVGIQEDKLTRIFEQGFTTRQGGHGYGLHSAANAAATLGGRLTAHSDGPGTGASFELHIPLTQPQHATAEAAATSGNESP